MRRPALLVWSSETQAALQEKHVRLFCCPFPGVAAEFRVSFRKTALPPQHSPDQS